MIYGVRYCDGTMMRFFPSEKEALEFVAAQQYAASCYRVDSYSDVEFAYNGAVVVRTLTAFRETKFN